MNHLTRRRFLQSAAVATAATAAGHLAQAADKPGSRMQFGLVTYLWGQNWDLPTLIANCSEAQVLGVELRTTHKHGVEQHLDRRQREQVNQRFADSDVTLVGLGSNERFDHPDAAGLQKAVETTKQFLQLSHDVGGSGVKVKPNSFHKDVPREKTIEQIGRALNQLGPTAADLGQQIRLEVHGQCAELPIMKQIMDVATHPSVGVCWNSNSQDLAGEGLAHNFHLVEDRFGATAHVRCLDRDDYPFAELIDLFVQSDYAGWVLLEARGNPADPIAALAQQGTLFKQMVAAAQAKHAS